MKNLIRIISAGIACLSLCATPVSASTYQYVTADSLNVRLTPSTTEENVVKSVPYRERLTVLEKGKEWSKILCANGSVAYCSSQYLSDTQPTVKKKETGKGKYIGSFTISHYCPCSVCNSGYIGTALGLPLSPYWTVAVDPRVIPLGTKLYIEGYGMCIAADTGGAIKGNRIDYCVGSHSEAYAKVNLLLISSI